MDTLDAVDARRILSSTHVLRAARVIGKLNLEPSTANQRVDHGLEIIGCEIDTLGLSCAQFQGNVLIQDCTFLDPNSALEGFATYFHAGFVMERCRSAGPVDLQCGGHNRNGNWIRIVDVSFEKFVNFFDCWFEGPVEVSRCKFKCGTNLLGNQNHPCRVTFDVAPIIEQNEGVLTLDGG